MHIIAILGSVIVTGALLVFGVQSWLNIDDLADCKAPSTLNAKCAPADAIIVISGGDTPARTNEAVQLYKKGWASKLVVSGAALDVDSVSNAEVMRNQAIGEGVPASAILSDEYSTNTIQNASNTMGLIKGADRVIVVTSPYHQRRTSIVFQRAFGDKVQIVNHPTPYDRKWPEQWWATSMGWWLAISESIKTLFVMVWPQ